MPDPARTVSMSQGHGNQFRLVLHTLCGLAPTTSFWRAAQFDTLRVMLIKVAARVTEVVTRIRLELPPSYPYRGSLVLLAGRATRPP